MCAVSRKGLFAQRGKHQVPAVEAIRAAVGNHVANLPEVVFRWVGEQVAGAAAIHAGNRLGRWLGWAERLVVLVVIHVFIQPLMNEGCWQ